MVAVLQYVHIALKAIASVGIHVLLVVALGSLTFCQGLLRWSVRSISSGLYLPPRSHSDLFLLSSHHRSEVQFSVIFVSVAIAQDLSTGSLCAYFSEHHLIFATFIQSKMKFPSMLITLLLVATTTLVFVHGQQNNAAVIASHSDTREFNNQLAKVGLSASDGKTIFAPNNEAFAKYQEKDPIMYPKYFNDNEFFLHRREILLWVLVTEDIFTQNQIYNGVRTKMENLNGNITINLLTQTLDNVQRTSFTTTDIITADGVVHIMDEMIIPPYMGLNIIGQCLEDQSLKFAFSTMANLAIFGDLRDVIDDIYDNGVTFLVPPNRRFNRAEINVPSLLTEEMQSYTRDFVRCHLLLNKNWYESTVFSYHEENEISSHVEVSYLGTHMWLTTSEDRVRFQSVDVLLPDQIARNGVFHGMDFPLFPPFASDFTFFTAISTEHDTSDMYRFFVQALLTSEDIATMFNSTLTVFAPSRGAFANFNNEDFQRLVEPIWVRHSTEFLLNHITTPALSREELVARAPSTITMLNGQTYDLRKSGLNPRLKNGPTEQAKVYFGDIIALDG